MLTLQKAIDICRANKTAGGQRHKMEQSGTIHFTREEKKHGPRENPRERNPCPTCKCKYANANIVVTLMQPETATAYGKMC